MKLELDFDERTIKITDNITIAELTERLKGILVDFEQWTILANETKWTLQPYTPNHYTYPTIEPLTYPSTGNPPPIYCKSNSINQTI